MKKLFTFCFLTVCLTGLKAQFNTLSFKPAEKPDEVEEVVQLEEINTVKEKRKKKERKSKSQLKSEIDSLKYIIEINTLLRKNDSLSHVINENRISKNQQIIIKNEQSKLDFISEPKSNNIQLSMPLNKMFITSPFGDRIHPISGNRKRHNGVDLRANFENVYSILNGRVKQIGYDSKAGYFIKITHSEKIETIYKHLSKINFSEGEWIEAGTIIGTSGSTGNSTGPHLHFAVKENGRYINPIQFLNELIELNNLIITYNEK